MKDGEEVTGEEEDGKSRAGRKAVERSGDFEQHSLCSGSQVQCWIQRYKHK